MRNNNSGPKPRERSAPTGLHRSRLLLWLAVLGVLTTLAGCGDDADRKAVELRIVSDRSVVFDAPGQTIQAVAQAVDADGLPVDVEITWESSEPDQIAIDDRGMMTALEPLGSAVITARYDELHAIATAVAVQLAPDGVLVDSAYVIEVLPEQINLLRNPATELIARGDVVLNGGDPGFLARVLRVDISGSEVVLTVEAAALTDAIAELELAFRVDAVLPEEWTDAGSDDGAGGAGGSAAQEPEIAPSVQQLTIPLECKLNSRLVNVEVTAFTFAPRAALSTDFRLRIQNQAVETLELALVGDFGVEAGFQQVKVTGGVRGKVECKVSLTAIPFAAIPIVGPIALAATATPSTGVEMELDYAATELALNGAIAKKAIRFRSGVGYDRGQGFRLISELDTLEDDLDFFAASQRPDDRFTAKIEPFFGVEYGIATTVGPLPIVNVGLLGTKVFGGYELEMTVPLSPEEIGYRGPRWNVYVGAGADIDPLLDELALFERFLSLFGLQGAQSLLGVGAKLFEVKLPLLESPAPTIAAAPVRVSNSQNVTLTYRDLGDTVGAQLEGLLWNGASMQTLGQLQTGGSGTEQLVWTPSQSEVGTFTAAVRLYDDLFGTIDLPYASDTRPIIEVQCTGQGCPATPNPVPPPSSTGPCMVSLPNGGRDFAEGASWTESRTHVVTGLDLQGATIVFTDYTTITRGKYLGDRRWLIDRSKIDRVLDGSYSATSEQSGHGATVRPWCDENGSLYGGGGSRQIERPSFDDRETIETRSWTSGGCHPWFGLGQDWVCMPNSNDGSWYPVDTAR